MDGADGIGPDGKVAISNPEAIDSGAEWMFQTFDHQKATKLKQEKK